MTETAAAGKAKQSAATRIVQLVLAAGVELFHDADQKAFAVVPVGGARHTLPLRGKNFIAWAKRLFYTAETKAAGAQAAADAIATLESQALFNGDQRHVSIRVAEAQGGVYLDLANDAWEAVLIRPGDCILMRELPVNFRRPRAMRQLPRPMQSDHAQMADLRKYINVEDADLCLLLAWTLFALTPRGPFPVLILEAARAAANHG